MATYNITIKTKNNTSAKDVIDEIGLDGYGKKYKYLFKTYESVNYKGNDYGNKVVSNIENEINTMLMTGQWKIKSIDVVTIGSSNLGYVYNVLYEYIETQTGIIE